MGCTLVITLSTAASWFCVIESLLLTLFELSFIWVSEVLLISLLTASETIGVETESLDGISIEGIG